MKMLAKSFGVVVLALGSGASASASIVQDPPKEVTLEGTVTLGDDGDRSASFGTFNLCVLDHVSGEYSVPVEVKSGKWSARVRDGLIEVWVGSMTLEQRSAHFDHFLEAPWSKPFEISAHWCPKNVLRVSSKSSGVEFTSGIELVASGNSMHPSHDDSRRARNVGSPIELPEFGDDMFYPERWLENQSWWVRVAGYAWTRVAVDHSRGGEWKAELAAAGDVIVELKATTAHWVWISLERGRETDRLDSMELPNTDPFVIDNLEPGSYRVVVQELTARSLATIASSDVIVAAGKITNLSIDVDPPPLAEGQHALAGRVSVPLEWGEPPKSFAGGLQFELERLDPVEHGYRPVRAVKFDEQFELTNAAQIWKWSAGAEPAGRYLAFVEPYMTSFVFDFDPTKDAPIEFAIAPPAKVHAKLIDDRTGAELRAQNFSWYGRPPPESSGVGGASVSFDNDSQSYAFRAPIGEVVLCTSVEGYEDVFQPATISAGDNQPIVRLSRATKIEIVLLDGTSKVAPTNDATVDVTCIGGDGQCNGREQGADRLAVFVDRSGTYEIDVHEVPGYVTLHPVRVSVAKGESIQLEIPVKRAK